MESRNLSTCLIGPFPISKVLSPSAVNLLLPRTLRIYSTFHVSRIIPLSHSPLSPVSRPTPLPSLIDSYSAYTVRHHLSVQTRGRGFQYLVVLYGVEQVNSNADSDEEIRIGNQCIYLKVGEEMGCSPGKSWPGSRETGLRLRLGAR